MPFKDLAVQKAYFKRKHREHWLVRQKFIQDQKSKPCADCGQTYGYWVMDFDHRDPKLKGMTVSAAARTRSLRKIKEEIAKCDVVCANCHRTRSYRNKVWVR